MMSRPPPPLDLIGDESFWTFDSFAAYAERLEARSFAGQHICAYWTYVSQG